MRVTGLTAASFCCTDVGFACVVRRSNATGNMYCEKWETMVDDVDRMFEWAVANKLNRIEWIMLGR